MENYSSKTSKRHRPDYSLQRHRDIEEIRDRRPSSRKSEKDRKRETDESYSNRSCSPRREQRHDTNYNSLKRHSALNGSNKSDYKNTRSSSRSSSPSPKQEGRYNYMKSNANKRRHSHQQRGRSSSRSTSGSPEKMLRDKNVSKDYSRTSNSRGQQEHQSRGRSRSCSPPTSKKNGGQQNNHSELSGRKQKETTRTRYGTLSRYVCEQYLVYVLVYPFKCFIKHITQLSLEK